MSDLVARARSIANTAKEMYELGSSLYNSYTSRKGGDHRRPPLRAITYVPDSSARKRNQKSNGRAVNVRTVRAPVNAGRLVRFAHSGVSNLANVRFQYMAGWVTVGDGSSLGVSDKVYFQPVTGAPELSLFFNPVAPSDPVFGVSYAYDFMKHFMRVQFNSIHLSIVPFGAGSNTSSALDIVVAPVRGGGYDYQTATGFVTAPNITSDSTIGMQGAKSFPAWKGCEFDLTPYIAGGSGARQNEFANSITTGKTAVTEDDPADLTLAVPCAFAVTGDVGAEVSGKFARAFMNISVDLLDFNGGNTLAAPPSPDSAKSLECSRATLANCKHRRRVPVPVTSAAHQASGERKMLMAQATAARLTTASGLNCPIEEYIEIPQPPLLVRQNAYEQSRPTSSSATTVQPAATPRKTGSG